MKRTSASAASDASISAPGLITLLGAALAVGTAAGFLELAVQSIQVNRLHIIGLNTLKVSRHVGWMVPVASASIAVLVTFLLSAPVCAWTAWRNRRDSSAGTPAWAWGWFGTVQGTLLFLGPILAIRGIYAAAVLVLALGLGYRLRNWFVRPSRGWQRASRWGGGMTVGILPVYAVLLASWVNGAFAMPLAPPPKEAPNLLWIVMDTVRASRMDMYGYQRETMPNLAKWSREGVTFDTARSAAPWTLPSHLSMFTGHWPYELGANINRPYSGPFPTLAEHLQSQGYTTAGIVANAVICNSFYGVGRGFESYVDYLCTQEVSLEQVMQNSALGSRAMPLARRYHVIPRPPLNDRRFAPEMADAARTWLDDAQANPKAGARDPSRPYFLFLNFFDAHGPYRPNPKRERTLFTGPIPPRNQAQPEAGWDVVKLRNAAKDEKRAVLQKQLDGITDRLSNLYDQCLHDLDDELGKLLTDLRASGKLQNTWVVITADHGEHLGEHGLYGHGVSLYNELTHVPLILIPPLAPEAKNANDRSAQVRGRRVRVPVTLRELPRTFADLLVPAAANPFPGRSLERYWGAEASESYEPILSQMEDQPLAGEDVNFEYVARMTSVIDEDHVYIENVKRDPELFDLYGDPKQDHDLSKVDAQRPRQARLKHDLDALLSQPHAQ